NAKTCEQRGDLKLCRLSSHDYAERFSRVFRGNWRMMGELHDYRLKRRRSSRRCHAERSLGPMAEDRPNFSDDFFRIVTRVECALDLVKNSAVFARPLSLRVELYVS